MEDDHQWKATSNGRKTPMEDKTPMQEDLQWKMTSIGRQLPIEDIIQWKTTTKYLGNQFLDQTQTLYLSLNYQTIFDKSLK
jgi:hypothetical protein